jgi:glucokinase
MLLYGFDIGGTKIGLSIGQPDGTILAGDWFATDRQQPPAAVLDECRGRLSVLHTRLALAQAPGAIGAACPGSLSSREGRFLEPPNMPAWHGFELVAYLRRHFACPIGMMNDADATVLAESLWGAACGVRCAIYLTMSTGMGAGLLLDGRVYEGACNLAGEIGHIRLSDDGPVGFGKRGSVEGYLSGPGIVQVADAEMRICQQIGEATILAAPNVDLTAEMVCRSAADGDPAALRVVDRCATALGRLMALMTDLLNPEVFILGTIGSAHYDLFVPRAREILDAEAIPHAAKLVRIVRSGLSDRGNQSAIAVAQRAVGATTG